MASSVVISSNREQVFKSGCEYFRIIFLRKVLGLNIMEVARPVLSDSLNPIDGIVTLLFHCRICFSVFNVKGLHIPAEALKTLTL